MTAHVSSVSFVPRSGESWRAPWQMYADLRDHDPVHHVVPEGAPENDYWVLSRHADVYAAARDAETFSSAAGLTTTYGELEKIGLQDNPPLVMLDPPDHTAFRRLVSKGFTPRQVTAVEPAVRAFVVERIERLREAGEGDVVKELFKPLPSMVVAHYLGVPEADRAQFDGWTEAIVAANAQGDTLQASGAVTDLMGYFTTLIERRRTDPEDDTISHLVASGMGPTDVTGLLSILGFAFTMVTGGNDTTTGMLGGAVQLLTHHREQRRDLIEHPELIGDAVEELLRLTSPVQGLARTTTRDVEIEGTLVPRGGRCSCCTVPRTATPAGSDRTPRTWMCVARRSRSSPSVTGPTTVSERPPRACRPGSHWRNCWRGAPTSPSTSMPSAMPRELRAPADERPVPGA
ncbi:hypothetical protein SAMN04490220_9199 [Rhodococcus jostii]|uniref:Cytochrome P450 n=1 Tax=Rhodococcus jostii TaxID=132919 RepID=A0A1H5MU06_RHOJO|nr:hypothetical protein SAMN04490220_9199 [Rhodococcus jostii]